VLPAADADGDVAVAGGADADLGEVVELAGHPAQVDADAEIGVVGREDGGGGAGAGGASLGHGGIFGAGVEEGFEAGAVHVDGEEGEAGGGAVDGDGVVGGGDRVEAGAAALDAQEAHAAARDVEVHVEIAEPFGAEDAGDAGGVRERAHRQALAGHVEDADLEVADVGVVAGEGAADAVDGGALVRGARQAEGEGCGGGDEAALGAGVEDEEDALAVEAGGDGGVAGADEDGQGGDAGEVAGGGGSGATVQAARLARRARRARSRRMARTLRRGRCGDKVGWWFIASFTR